MMTITNVVVPANNPYVVGTQCTVSLLHYTHACMIDNNFSIYTSTYCSINTGKQFIYNYRI